MARGNIDWWTLLVKSIPIPGGVGKLLPSAGHVDDRSSYAGRLLGKEPESGIGDIFRLTASLHGNRRPDPIDASRLAPFGVQLGVDEPRSNGIHADALLCNFGCQADGERLDST